ncbi:MAG: 6-bladed beta-propeller [Candidatus Firestonebacteria bacterium]|nr:6-bladed beta-propeller [Candidatus Firestonebacteria bacterium]
MKILCKSFLIISIISSVLFLFNTSSNCFSRFKEGDVVYEFTTKDIAGNQVALSNAIINKNAKVIALIFWKVPEEDTIRSYSEEEIVLIKKLYKLYESNGFDVVTVYCPWGDENLTPEETKKMNDVIKKNNLIFPVLIDHGLKIYNQFGISALPSVILMDNKKVSKYLLAGYYPSFADKSIKQEIEKMLALTEEQKIKEITPIYDLKYENVGQSKTKFISDRLWGEKLIISFYGKINGKSLNNPTSFAVGENGKIYVVDSLNAVINVYDMYGKYLFNFGNEGFAGENLALPWNITVDYKGRIYITDIARNLICIYSPEGKFLIKFGGTGSNEGQLNMPFDLAIDSNSNLYVVDSQNDRVQIINGNFKFKIGSSGSKDGEFSLPTAIALSQDETLIYIVDTNNSRVQVFDKRGNFIRKFGRPGSQKGEFNHPDGIVVDSEGRIFVSDTLNNRIQIFDKEGIFLGMFGHFGSGDGEFNSPGKSFIDYKGRFYVIDRKNNRIQGFSLKYIQTFL